MSYSFVDVESLEPSGPIRFVRKALDARAFGCNYFSLPAGQAGREHDHAESDQEEVYFVVRGSGTIRIDGDELELRPGRFVRVDPPSTRTLVAGPDGLEFLSIGAPLGGGYEPPSWG